MRVFKDNGEFAWGDACFYEHTHGLWGKSFVGIHFKNHVAGRLCFYLLTHTGPALGATSAVSDVDHLAGWINLIEEV